MITRRFHSLDQDLYLNSIFLCLHKWKLGGFFTSARGIGQGCSLSRYLYVILNNVLSKMLNQFALEGSFGYNQQCQAVRLSHLSFYGDLLVFTDGTVESLNM